MVSSQVNVYLPFFRVISPYSISQKENTCRKGPSLLRSTGVKKVFALKREVVINEIYM